MVQSLEFFQYFNIDFESGFFIRCAKEFIYSTTQLHNYMIILLILNQFIFLSFEPADKRFLYVILPKNKNQHDFFLISGMF